MEKAKMRDVPVPPWLVSVLKEVGVWHLAT